MTLQIEKLQPLFAAEVSGVDLRTVDDATFAEIEAAFEEHSVLVFPDQDLDDEAQMDFSRRFGELEMMAPHAANQLKRDYISRHSNVGPDGELLQPDSRAMVYQSANRLWHTDSSFKPVPSKASLLHGRHVPPEGGETEFATMRAAFEALPPERQAELEGRVAFHWFANSRNRVAPGLLSDWQKENLKPVRQALVRANPVNGRKSLYLGAHAGHVEDMEEEAGRAFMEDLLAYATEDRFVYAHKWRQHDLVMWDNRCVLHRGRPWDFANHARVMHRTTVAGDGPTI